MTSKRWMNNFFFYFFSQKFEFKVNDLIQYLNRDDEEIRPLAICLPITLPLVLSSGVKSVCCSNDHYIIIHSILIHFRMWSVRYLSQKLERHTIHFLFICGTLLTPPVHNNYTQTPISKRPKYNAQHQMLKTYRFFCCCVVYVQQCNAIPCLFLYVMLAFTLVCLFISFTSLFRAPFFLPAFLSPAHSPQFWLHSIRINECTKHVIKVSEMKSTTRLSVCSDTSQLILVESLLRNSVLLTLPAFKYSG